MRLVDLLPERPGTVDADDLLVGFAEWAERRGLPLYPAQEEALTEVFAGSNVILATPTGSGKSLVAVGAHVAALASGRRSFYTAPIKALVSEKFFDLCHLLGTERVGMMTGDAAVNPEAPVICCTAEILANLALRHGEDADLGMVVMDEFHFYADPDRGWAWQVPLLELSHVQFLLMSATLGDVRRFRDDLVRRTGRPTAVVTSAIRPVPLHFEYRVEPIHELLDELRDTDLLPAYVVHFTQAAALERAQALMSVNFCSKEEKAAIAELIGEFRFSTAFGRTLSRLVRHGVGVHHAGMLPRYRRLVERLAQAGLLKVVCGTDTLGVGINVPIRTVVFTALSKYDGSTTRLLSAREFHQIAGRAGRAGFDTSGTVVVLAPEHAIENERAVARAGDDPRKRRKLVRKKPPEGFVSWGEPTFARLREATPETLVPRFAVSHAMLLNVIARPGDACAQMRRLLTDNHQPRGEHRKLVHEAIARYRALLAAGVVEPLAEPDGEGRRVRLTVELQEDFALNQPLSPFALAAIELLDPQPDTYALDVVSVIEATLEDPRALLRAQEHRARGEAVAEMKADGVEYEERMARLEEVTHPKPLEELLEAAFDAYRLGHPWVADHTLSPKSVVRDLYERAMNFVEYVGFYEQSRAEGVLLRYLSDAYRALDRTVPDEAKTDDLEDLIAWLGELVRQVDSSLLDEWEHLSHPDAPARPPAEALDHTPPPVTANRRAFRVLVRNELFRRVELAARRRWEQLSEIDAAAGWTADRWAEALAAYFADHDEIGTGPGARGPGLFVVDESAGRWRVRQILDDPAGHHDWAITAEVDLAGSDRTGTAVVVVTAVGQS